MTTTKVYEWVERAMTLADVQVVTDLFNAASLGDLGLLDIFQCFEYCQFHRQNVSVQRKDPIQS